MTRLACRSCGRILTLSCEWGDVGQRDESVGDEQSPVPPGLIIRMKERSSSMFHGGGHQTSIIRLAAINEFALNPKYVVENSLVSCGKDFGCCGSSGCDGPNRACKCGKVVATEWSDCWTWAEIRFISDNIIETE